MNFLVTGVGGNIAQSICKILKESESCNEIVGTDLHEKHAGKYLCNHFYVLPRCSEENYIEEIKKIIRLRSIEIIIPGSEPELKFFYDSDLTEISSCSIIMANKKTLKIGFDKLITERFLERNNLPFPETDIINNVEFPTYPSILKSRSDSGSKNIFMVNDQIDFEFFKRKYPGFILQEYLSNDNKEFTCGLFRSKSGETRSIIFKRKLAGGYSIYGEVVENKEISNLLLNVAEKLDLNGSINVQLRLTKKGPVIFEINPRFSSTVYFRHLFGFKDVIWSVEDRFGNEIGPYIKPKPGSAFYRGDSEYYELL